MDNSLEKPLIMGKIEGRRIRGRQKMCWLDGITNAMNMNFSKLWELVRDRQACHAAIRGVSPKEVGTTGSLNNNRLNVLMKRHYSY